MLVDASAAVSPTSVTGAIRKAAQLTGTSFRYLLATAKVESNLDPRAAAKTSSAGGLFQFIDQTWLGTLKEQGAALGYARQADAITRNASGQYVVSDPRLRAEIMNLRQDPTANAVMAGAFTRSNAAILSEKLGRAASENELYIAHFLGANGAAKLIGQAERNPNVRASDSFPLAARANRSIFFDRNGRARNAAEVRAALAGRFEVAAARQNPAQETAQIPAQAPAQVAAAPTGFAFAPLTPPSSAAQAGRTVAGVASVPEAANARVARAYEALAPAAGRALPRVPAVAADPQSAEPTYHNPYRASERRAAVSPAVTDLWAQAAANVARVRTLQAGRTVEVKRPPVAAADTAAAKVPVAPPPAERVANVQPPSAGSEPLGLFQDHKPNVRALFGS
ncbi:MAG: lytic transglycosylase domain-containing protein [Alphaproteobacteria bacterium]|nr:lytic transglycosylase domain-containing protein [Alphaproteobacteria bacterium]GIK81946.1 MAG: transglycosylase [Alphaproteobacteria bacterium]